MGFFSALLFSVFIGVGICKEFATEDSNPDALVPVTIFITTEQYRICKEYGLCTFTPRSVSLNEPVDLHGNLEDKSYFDICRKIHIKMEKLESEHPEIKHLNLKLKQMLGTLTSDFEFESKKGELVALKLLDLVKNLIEKLKVEFDDKSHKIHKPEPIPIIEPITEEITAEPETGHSIFVGSIRGIPGIHFPNYTEIPITSFTCSDKKVIPGFYADLETGCQVFHLCYEHRRESFLCPVGTIFNQPILACDYWYSANCSLAPNYYEKPNIPEPIITTIKEEKEVVEIVKHPKEEVDFLKFLPVKGNVIEIPEFGKPIKTPKVKPVTFKDTEIIADKIFDGILSLGSKVISKTSDMIGKIPDPQEIPMKLEPIEDKLKAKAFSALPLFKAKKITSAAKLGAATKIASAAAFTSGKAKMAAIPLIKSKVAAASVLPMMKTKVALGAIPFVKAGAAAAKVPVVKTKMALGALPLVKAGAAAAKVPVVKTKMALGAIPLVKAGAAAAKVPVVKTKMALGALPLVKAGAAAAKVPVVKTKMALGAIPLVKAGAAAAKVPVVKTKMALGAIPLVKAGAAAAKVPIMKTKMAVPYLKMAALKPKFVMAPLKVKSAVALPLMKTKLVAAAVSPLTKKALALGYLKLLKAKKMTLMG